MRRSFLSLTAGPVIGAGVVAPQNIIRFDNPDTRMFRKRYFGRFDFRNHRDSTFAFSPSTSFREFVKAFVCVGDIPEANRPFIVVNGKVIKHVQAADTEAGWVRTLDVLGTGPCTTLKPGQPGMWSDTERIDISNHSGRGYAEYMRAFEFYQRENHWKPEDFPGREVLCAPRDVLVEIVRGKVEFWGASLTLAEYNKLRSMSA